MLDTFIRRQIGTGQCNNQKYLIYSIYKQSTLIYWYVVILEETLNDIIDDWYYKTNKTGFYNETRKLESVLTDFSIDIRTLPNYKDEKVLFWKPERNKWIVHLIKEAVRKKYIKPV